MDINISFGQNTKDWIDIFSALLTPVIAIFAGYIGYQQWKTAEAERKQNLYEMRYDNLFNSIIENSKRYAKMTTQDLNKLDFEEQKRLDSDFKNNLNKYKYLIKKKDYERLNLIYGALSTCSRKVEELKYENIEEHQLSLDLLSSDINKFLNEIEEISDKYLRIEPEPTNLWKILGDILKNIILFILPLDKIL